MNRFLLLGVLIWFNLIYSSTHAQATQPPRPVTVEGRLDYDTFFGFYPSLTVSRPLDSLHTVMGYGIFYTDPAFSGAETGLRLSFPLPRKNGSVVPGMGLVSGSVFVQGRSFAVAEGYTGSVAARYEQSGWLWEFYGGYYGALKRKTTDTYDFAFYTLQAGRILSKRISINFVFAQLGNVRLPRNQGDTSQFGVSRFGIGTTLSLPAQFMAQAAGGLTAGADQPTFFQVGLSRSLPHH